jgi:DNA-binding beta-propeller fold protein YncE
MANQWYPRVEALRDLYDFFKRGALEGYNQPRSVTAATTLLASDRLLLCTTTGGAFTVTLGPAENYLPQPYYVKLLAGANNVTLDADGTELIYTNAGAGTLAWNTAGMTKIVIPCLVASPATWGWIELNT